MRAIAVHGLKRLDIVQHVHHVDGEAGNAVCLLVAGLLQNPNERVHDECEDKPRNATHEGDAPINHECDDGKGHELQDSGHCHRRELIGIAGAGGVIADGIGKAPAALIGIETPAGVEYGLDEPAPQIDGDAGPGDSGIGKGTEHDD